MQPDCIMDDAVIFVKLVYIQVWRCQQSGSSEIAEAESAKKMQFKKVHLEVDSQIIGKFALGERLSRLTRSTRPIVI
jgi:hypothetical protein